jgi:type VII secretion-associated serine protease mycosin
MLRRAFVAGALLAVSLAVTPAGSASADNIRDSQQWVLDMLNVPQAWQQSTGRGVTVAVIDSGVDGSVSDLTGSVTTGPDLSGLHTPESDPGWGVHGTWMASIIAGHGHDGGGDGVIGVAPDARILSIRVIPDHSDPGYAAYDRESESRIQMSLAAAIRDAVNDGAKVISMSIGYSVPSAAVRSALEYAYDKGTVVVASSGNSGADDETRDDGFAPVSFPADYPGVIGVGAVTSDGGVASFSSANLSVLVSAPGVNVPAQGRDGQYWLVSGTSPACALVAGVAALIKSEYPWLAPDLVAQALTYDTSDRPANGYDVSIGFGVVNAPAALTEARVLARPHSVQAGSPESAHFGGGPAAIPAAPVRSRGVAWLIVFSLLAALSLAVAIAAVMRIVAIRRSRLRIGAHAASFGTEVPSDGRLFLACPRRRGLDTARQGDVLRRHRRLPRRWRPATGRPRDGQLRGRRPLVACHSLRRHAAARPRARGPCALSR